MQRLALVVVSLVVVAGCHQDNPESCELPSNAGNGVCPGIDAAIDTPTPPECTVSNECMAPDKGVCDTALNGGTCVQCTAASAMACKGKTPACINDVCAPCTRHADCTDSKVCMPDGACANENDVAYLDGGGTDQMMCTKAMPCTKIEKAAMAKSILKITGTLTERATLNGRDVVILADPKAKLTPMQDGAALEVRDGKVQIYDLEISHMPSGNAKEGIFVNDDQAEVELTRVSIINNTADGARVNAGHLTCTRCTIAQNTLRGINLSAGEVTISRSVIQGNAGGGILIGQNGIFQIVANFIFGNGSSGSLTGGINGPALDGNSANRIDFNSISHNNASGIAGIQCSSGMQLTAKYNIIWKNGSLDQVNAGGCQHISSDIGPLPSSPTASNFNSDPRFQDEANGDLHLMSDSPVRRLVQPQAPDVTGIAASDFDGDTRMSVPMLDLGADQTP
jgi:Right handed beta helix region